jgi:polysaccharide pyruvyl transferase WcaK-like protein
VVLIGYAPKVDGLADALGPAGALVRDDPAGYGRLSEAARTVIGRADEAATARAELRSRAGVHAMVLDRLLDR